MRKSIAIIIVNKCNSYKEKWGFWPEPSCRKDKRNIFYAFKIVNGLKQYEPGDFSFIKNKIKMQALIYDYNIITNLNAWNVLKNHDPLDNFLDDTYGGIWDIIYKNSWRGHNNESLVSSMKNMEFISKNGWNKYVKIQKM